MTSCPTSCTECRSPTQAPNSSNNSRSRARNRTGAIASRGLWTCFGWSTGAGFGLRSIPNLNLALRARQTIDLPVFACKRDCHVPHCLPQKVVDLRRRPQSLTYGPQLNPALQRHRGGGDEQESRYHCAIRSVHPLFTRGPIRRCGLPQVRLDRIRASLLRAGAVGPPGPPTTRTASAAERC